MKVEILDFQTLTLCKIFTSYAQNLEMSSLLVGRKVGSVLVVHHFRFLDRGDLGRECATGWFIFSLEQLFRELGSWT